MAHGASRVMFEALRQDADHRRNVCVVVHAVWGHVSSVESQDSTVKRWT